MSKERRAVLSRHSVLLRNRKDFSGGSVCASFFWQKRKLETLRAACLWLPNSYQRQELRGLRKKVQLNVMCL